MHDERQKLITNVFIKFRKLAKQRGVEVTEIELRTGVTNATGHIAKVCLEQVDRCIDSPIFFLGILGSYYGWDKWYEVEEKESLKDEHRAIIEKYPNISITELEIRYAIANPKHNQALFYVTKPIKDEEPRLVALKEELKGYATERDNLGFDYYKSDEEFAQKVYGDLEIAFNKIYLPNQRLSEVEKLRASHEAFALSRYKGYVRYEENEKILDEFLSPHNHNDRLLLYGQSGYGKSALVANYFKRFREESSAFVIEHYIGGAGELSSDFYAMLRRVMLEIKEEFSIEEDVPTKREEIINEFGVWLQKVKRQTVIVLDGYNQIEDEVKERFLKYYLSVKFKRVKLIVTSIKSDYAIANKKEITKLNRQKQKELVEKYLGIYGKKLTYDVNELLKHNITENTLFLRTLLEEIRLLGVYESISGDIAEYLKAKDLKELFVKIFIRYERDYDAVLIREVLSLLYNSRDGLSQNSLLEIIEKKREVDRYKFYPMILALEEHLVNHGGLYRFFHDYIKMAVESRYLSNDELMKHYKRELVDYFEKQEIDNQRVRELPYLLLLLEDREGLYGALVVVEFFVAIQEVDEYELLGYVRFVDEIYPISDELTNELLTKEYNSETINNIGYFFHLTYADYDNALLLFKKMMKLDRDDSSIVINNYNNIGGLYATMGNYKRSFIMHKRAVTHSIEFFGENHLDTAICYNSLAFVYESCEKFDEALEFYQKALKIREAILGENHPQTAILYNNIAGIYSILAEYKKALNLYEKALLITTKTLGKNHPENSTHYNNIAWIHYTMGDYETALKEYNLSLDISVNAVGENHPSSLQSYDNLASCYLSMGRYSEAFSIFEDTLMKTKNVFGEEHIETAITMGNLATTYYNLEEYDKGIVLAKQALAISEKVLGKYSHTTATKYNNLALFYSALEEYDKALELYKIALKISIEIRGDEHPDTAISYNNLAGVYESKEEYDVAFLLYQKALKIYEDVFGEEHPDTAMLYNNLAYLYEAMGKLEDSLSLYKRAYGIKREFLGDEHPDVIGIGRNIELVRGKLGVSLLT